VKPHRLSNPVPLHDGNGLACRILEMGPSQVHFNMPILLEVPYYASLRGRERELVVFRSDNGDTWKEHPLEANEKSVKDAIGNVLDNAILSDAEMREKRILRILTTDLPVYFAIISRIRQETSLIGKEGGLLVSSTLSQVQAVFPTDALQKPIKVGLQAQPMNHELCLQVLEAHELPSQIRFSPIVTIEPRRRKFHRPITLTIPLAGSSDGPSSPNKGTKAGPGNNLELRLLCSITGGSSSAQWEDITGSTPLSRVRESVSFTTTVSARFWLLECPKNVSVGLLDAANRIYTEVNRVPYLGRLAIYGKMTQSGTEDGVIRAVCLIDDNPDKTLECQQEFTRIATGPVVEVINEQTHHVELVEGMTPLLHLSSHAYPVAHQGMEDSNVGRRIFSSLPIRAFTENRTVSIPVHGKHGKIVLWSPPVDDTRSETIGQPGTSPLVVLDVDLPEESSTSTPQIPTILLPAKDELAQDKDSWHRTLTTAPWKDGETICNDSDSIARSELDLMEVANMVGGDWINLARELDISHDDLWAIQSNENTLCEEARALEMLTLWQQEAGPKANGNELARALHAIGREDVVKTSMHNITVVTSDQEKNEARELLGIDGKHSGQSTPFLRVDTLNSVEDSMVVETGGDDEDALREMESKSMDKVLVDGREGRILDEDSRSGTPAMKGEEEEFLVPQIDARRGVITHDKKENETQDPEALKSRQEAYLNLIEEMENLLPPVEITEPARDKSLGDEIDEETLVPQNPVFQQQSINLTPREDAPTPEQEKLVNIPVELWTEDGDVPQNEEKVKHKIEVSQENEKLVDIPVELWTEETVDDNIIVPCHDQNLPKNNVSSGASHEDSGVILAVQEKQ
jgi:ankyrin